ncbi:hypothetical protein [Fimbriiglobus ruber]|uniref:hypothetical protein n=1 Tax=Fimbriiglobus ruber TaxID=1908690 RepID=UPI00117B505A|nr:hypothetical protein [Fimbriiglobus ruber]
MFDERKRKLPLSSYCEGIINAPATARALSRRSVLFSTRLTTVVSSTVFSVTAHVLLSRMTVRVWFGTAWRGTFITRIYPV